MLGPRPDRAGRARGARRAGRAVRAGRQARRWPAGATVRHRVLLADTPAVAQPVPHALPRASHHLRGGAPPRGRERRPSTNGAATNRGRLALRDPGSRSLEGSAGPARRWSSSRRCSCWSPLVIKLDSRGPGVLRPQARGQGRAALPLLEVPHHVRGRGRARARAARAEPGGRPAVQAAARPADHPRRRLAARQQPRRAAPALQRGAGADEPGRARGRRPSRRTRSACPGARAGSPCGPASPGSGRSAGTSASAGDFHQWIQYDLLYVRHSSFAVDVKILLATVLTGGGKGHVPLSWILPARVLGEEAVPANSITPAVRRRPHRALSRGPAALYTAACAAARSSPPSAPPRATAPCWSALHPGGRGRHPAQLLARRAPRAPRGRPGRARDRGRRRTGRSPSSRTCPGPRSAPGASRNRSSCAMAKPCGSPPTSRSRAGRA